MPGFFIPRDGASGLCRCQGRLDKTGHHSMNCNRQLGGLSAGHTEVAQAVASVARRSGNMYTDRPSQVPHHDNSEKMGDALCSLSRVNNASMLLDFTMAHVKDTLGSQWTPNVLQDRWKDKMAKHSGAYSRAELTFVPCVTSTFGRLQADFIRLLVLYARERAELVHTYHRPDANLKVLSGVFFSEAKAVVGAAVARGMAMRAMRVQKLDAYFVFR